MANIIGTLTINQSKFYELDAHPLLSTTSGVEVGDFCIVDSIPGIWQKVGNGDFDFSRVDLLFSQSTQATANGTLTLISSSSNIQVFTGSTSGQILKLPDATTIAISTRYEIWNTSTTSIALVDNGSNAIITISSGEVGFILLNDNSTANGVWKSVSIMPPTGVSYGNPVALSPDSGNSDGVATAVARADHLHNVPTATAVGLDANSTSTQGAAATFARSNHTHALATGTPSNQTIAAAVAAGTSANIARADHIHTFATAAPSTDLTGASTNSDGTSTSFSRADHSHAVSLVLDNLTDVVAATPLLNDRLVWNGVSWVNQASTNPISAGAGVNLFFGDTASGIGSYDFLYHAPDGAAEAIDSAVVNNNTVLILGYISDFDTNSVIDGGVWNFNIYAKSSLATGINTLTFKVYKRTSGGTETLLFEVTSTTINNTVPVLFIVTTAQQQFSCNLTDKLLVKVYATTDNVVDTTISFYHSGTEHYSYISTPLVTNHNDLAGLQGGTSTERFHLTTAQVTKLDNLSTFVSKSGIVTAGTFAGNPKKATVTFGTAFASTAYNVNITGSDGRSWTVESRLAASFIINSQANTALTGDVYWQANISGEVL